MRNIAIIGAGQLGTRHLQSLSLLTERSRIIIVDPTEFGQQLAINRWSKTEKNVKHTLSIHSNIREVKCLDFDLVIISTNSDVRKKVVEECLSLVNVKYLILEKFLFQKINDYQVIEKLLRDNSISTYVNCPMRLYPDYQIIKRNINISDIIKLEVKGNNWGIAGNSVHYADLLLWLTGEYIISWKNELNDGYFESKREGFIEFSGGLTGITKSGHSIHLHSSQDITSKLTVEISNSQTKWLINEVEGDLEKVNLQNASIINDKSTFTVKRQSELSNIVAKNLFDTGSCSLTPYEESAKLHIPLLKVFKEHYNKCSKKNLEHCPIT